MKQGLWLLGILLAAAYLLLEQQSLQTDSSQLSAVTDTRASSATKRTSAKFTKSNSKASNKAITDYAEARRSLWRSLYASGGKTLYCQQAFTGGDRDGLNVEHIFPMSWVTNSLDCGTRKQCRARSAIFNQIEADLHNLYPSRTDVNSDRSSFRFGDVKGEERRYGKACDFEVDHRARVAEPTPSVRGEVARSMFYMAYKYRDQGLTIFAKQAKLLHAWHLADPPTASERQRNTRIEVLQGNVNPFIEQPSLLSELFKQGEFR